jgi:hypothetical protein
MLTEGNEDQLIERLRTKYPTFRGSYKTNNALYEDINLLHTFTTIEYYDEQRSLVEIQKKATFWMKWATIVIALATVAQIAVAVWINQSRSDVVPAAQDVAKRNPGLTCNTFIHSPYKGAVRISK